MTLNKRDELHIRSRVKISLVGVKGEIVSGITYFYSNPQLANCGASPFLHSHASLLKRINFFRVNILIKY